MMALVTLNGFFESTGEMKPMMKFACICTSSLNFEIYFLLACSHGKLFLVLLQAITFVFSFKKM